MGMAEWGYSVLEGSPSEQFTTSGAEASVKYIGPSLYRVPFIKEVFGAWHINSAQVSVPISENESIVKTYRCALMSPEVTAYPYMTVLNEEAQCTGEVCLWPDTFSGQPSGDSKPYLLNCGAGSDLGYPILDQCAWEYTVNYRYKNNGMLPEILNSDRTVNPSIPFGTYTECRVTTSNEFMTTPGRFWEYRPNALSGAQQWNFRSDCAEKNQLLNIDDETFATQFITTTNIEVVWSNVPLPPWDIIRWASGCVNSHPIFGFPAGAVLFEFAEPEITGYFGCMEVYRLRYVFKVKTVAVQTAFDYPDGSIVNGQLGIWNRRWCPCPILAGIHPQGGEAGEPIDAVCTHWVPVVSKQQNNAAGGVDITACDNAQIKPVFRSFPFHMLFAMNVCTCAVNANNCQEQFGTVAIADPATNPEIPWSFLIPGVSQATFTNLPQLAGMSFTPYEPAP